MNSLITRLPDAEVVLAMEPEELGVHVLHLLRDERNNQGQVILNNALGPLTAGYAVQQEAVMDAVAEAWAWLESERLLVSAWRSGGTASWRVLSRRARSFVDSGDGAPLRHGASLPREFLHPSLPAQVWPNFMKGDLDTAVFQAMKQVEVALRDASGLLDETSGVRLARRAFNPETGPLRDRTAEAGERQGMMDLFAGALATLKNPHSHRNVHLTNPADAAAAVLLASYLLRVIDEGAWQATIE